MFSGLGENIAGLDARLTPDLDDAIIARISCEAASRWTRSWSGTPSAWTIRIDDASRRFTRKPAAAISSSSCRGDPAADTAARLIWIGDARCGRHRLSRHARCQRAICQISLRWPRSASGSSATPRCERLRATAALYRAADAARPDIRQRRSANSAKRFAVIVDEAESDYDTFPKARGARLSRHFLESLQGHLQVGRSTARARRKWTRGRRAMLHCRRRPHLSGRPCRAAGYRAARRFHGIAHAERNGHHYVDGFAATPADEVAGVSGARIPISTRSDGGKVRLAIHDGALTIGSLTQVGFASGVDPALDRRMRRFEQPTPAILQERRIMTTPSVSESS